MRHRTHPDTTAHQPLETRNPLHKRPRKLRLTSPCHECTSMLNIEHNKLTPCCCEFVSDFTNCGTDILQSQNDAHIKKIGVSISQQSRSYSLFPYCFNTSHIPLKAASLNLRTALDHVFTPISSMIKTNQSKKTRNEACCSPRILASYWFYFVHHMQQSLHPKVCSHPRETISESSNLRGYKNTKQGIKIRFLRPQGSRYSRVCPQLKP